MKLFVFFGLPGTGKTFCAKVAEKYFGYHLYDGDNDLTLEMHTAIQKQEHINDEMRDIFFTRLIQSVNNLAKEYDKLVIHQTFIKEKYREQFLKALPEAKFVLVQTDTKIRERRLSERIYYPLDTHYAQKMTLLFDTPHIPYIALYNDEEGEKSLKEQLEKILL
jgi:gluconate kinase